MSQTTAPPVICFRWPAKALYLTADEASLALREIFYARHYYGSRLVAYRCWGADVEHHHLGNLMEGDTSGRDL